MLCALILKPLKTSPAAKTNIPTMKPRRFSENSLVQPVSTPDHLQIMTHDRARRYVADDGLESGAFEGRRVPGA